MIKKMVLKEKFFLFNTNLVISDKIFVTKKVEL